MNSNPWPRGGHHFSEAGGTDRPGRLTESTTRDWRVRPILSSGGQHVPVPHTVSGSNQRRMNECAVGAALYPRADSIEKIIGCPMVAEVNKFHPLPMNHRVGDRASGEKRLSRKRRNRCRPLRSLP